MLLWERLLTDVYRRDSYADAYFTLRSTYLRGRPPKTVNFYWRRFPIVDIPLNDQKEFEDWIYKRWEEKDKLLDQFIETGRFPPFEADTPSNRKGPEASVTGSEGYIESEIKLGHWAEVGKVFAILIAAGLALKFLPHLWS